MSWLENNEFRGLNPQLLARMQLAAQELRWVETATARDLTALASDHLGLGTAAADLAATDMSALEFGNLTHQELETFFLPLFPTGTDLASNLADQIQLCRAFANPQQVVSDITARVVGAAQKFPQNAADLKVGENKGDVLDPFILVGCISERS